MQEKSSVVGRSLRCTELYGGRKRQKYLCQPSSHSVTNGSFHAIYGSPNMLEVKDLAFYSVSFSTALHPKQIWVC